MHSNRHSRHISLTLRQAGVQVQGSLSIFAALARTVVRVVHLRRRRPGRTDRATRDETPMHSPCL